MVYSNLQYAETHLRDMVPQQLVGKLGLLFWTQYPLVGTIVLDFPQEMDLFHLYHDKKNFRAEARGFETISIYLTSRIEEM